VQSTNKTKILVYLAVWQRPEITELCFVGIQRLREHPEFDIQVLAVVSETSMFALCKKYDVNYVFSENLPLGRKKNAGLKEAQRFDFDYMLEIGSDDLVLNDLLDWYKPKIEAKELFFGIRDIAFLESDTGECRRLISRSTYGAGRMIHRSVLEKMDWTLWSSHINSGLDNNSVFKMKRIDVHYTAIAPREYPPVIDVKSDTNIWKFNYLLGVEYDKSILFEKLSQKEVEMIESYVTEHATDR
jgi:hypothetical protein